MSHTIMDELNRVLISKEIREVCNIGTGVHFDVSVKDGAIILRPLEKVCAVCQNAISKQTEMPLCEACITKVKAMQ